MKTPVLTPRESTVVAGADPHRAVVQTAVECGIRSIPTLIFFKGGEKLDTIIGAVPKATLEAKLLQILG